ncbi:MAG: hypothetical protein K6G61_12540 [Solobacterium sp.]|nr:hypothetical protein [Solobacterium sp.]
MHFPVIVITETIPEDSRITAMLAPYDEKNKTDPHVIHTYAEVKEYLRSICSVDGSCEEYLLLKALEEDDIEILRKCNRALEIFYDISEKGEAMSVGNPQAKWDHRAYGGRFAAMLDDCALKDFPDIRTMRPFVLVTPEGEWIEPGRDAWWLGAAAAKEADTDWREEFSRIIRGYPDTYRATVIDCHI